MDYDFKIYLEFLDNFRFLTQFSLAFSDVADFRLQDPDFEEQFGCNITKTLQKPDRHKLFEVRILITISTFLYLFVFPCINAFVILQRFIMVLASDALSVLIQLFPFAYVLLLNEMKKRSL